MRKLLALLLLLPLLAHAGTVTGNIQTASSGAVVNGTLTFTLNQFAVVSGTAQVVATGVQCYTSTAGAITGEPDPQTAPVLSVNLGSGTLAAGTYFVKYTYFDGTGESLPSPEASVTLVSPGTVIVAVPAIQPANATGWRIYISAATGTETRQSSQTGFAASYQQTAALSAGTALPGTNTSACSIRFTDEMIPSTTYYTINLVNSQGSKIAGYPISQARFYGGTNGSVNVSSGWPVSIGGVIWPSPIVSTPNSNATQSIAGGLNLATFPLTAGNGTFSGNGSFGGTLGVTGPITATGANIINCKNFDGIRCADQFPGPDICAQIAAARDDLPAQGGTVDARAFNTAPSFICTSGTLTIGSTTKPVKLLLPPTIIINNAATVAFNLVNGCIVGDGTNGIGSRLQNNTASADVLQINGSRNCVHDVTVFRGAASAGAAVHIIGAGTTSSNHNDLRNVRADCTNSNAGSIGFQLTANSVTALVAENTFSQVFTDECDVDFQFDTTGTQGPTDNDFFGVHDVNTSGGTVGIKISGANTALNRFYGGIIANKVTGISIASPAAQNKFYGVRLESNTTNLVNAGVSNEFYGLGVDVATITDTDTTSTMLGGGNASFTQKLSGANVAKRLDTQFLLAPVTGTGAFATLFTTSIPANTLGKNGCVRAHFAYLHSTGTANISYKITLGATTLQGAWTDAGTAQANSSVTICNRAATNSQGAWSLAVFDGTTIANAAGIAVASEDTTTTLNLALQFSVANTDAVTPRGWIVEMF